MKTTNGPATNISMAFVPNACDGPHLGHLYSLLLSRLMYLNIVSDKFAKEQKAPQYLNDSVTPIQPQYYLCIDHKDCHAVDDYIKMIEWLGWDDMIIFRNDLANYAPMYNWTGNKLESNEIKDSYTTIERRIMFFNWAGVYMHYRGEEIRIPSWQANESMIARHLNMRMPTMIYHPVILNEEGTKIEGNDPDYCLKDIFNKPAFDVIEWFVNWLCPKRENQTNMIRLALNISDKDNELHYRIWRLSGPENHPVPSRINESIPRTWKDNIKNSN